MSGKDGCRYCYLAAERVGGDNSNRKNKKDSYSSIPYLILFMHEPIDASQIKVKGFRNKIPLSKTG